jgi:hypothetical protein
MKELRRVSQKLLRPRANMTPNSNATAIPGINRLNIAPKRTPAVKPVRVSGTSIMG